MSAKASSGREAGGALPRVRRLLRQAGLIALITLVIAEVAVRFLKPPPRLAIVRGNAPGFRVVNGVPVWSQKQDDAARCAMRAPQALRIAFFGTSITFGHPFGREGAFPGLLEQRLGSHFPAGVCVDNTAISGFGVDQELVTLREYVAQERPKILFFELWDVGKRYRMLGSDAFDLRSLDLGEAGYPKLASGPVGQALFKWSRLFEYSSLALSEPATSASDPAARLCDEVLPELEVLSARVGAKLVLYFPAPLWQPFSKSLLMDGPDATIPECARKRGVTLYVLAEELRDQDNEKLRADPCCHLNATGHAAVADVFERHEREWLPPAGP